jgi:ADP-heptose:LPS heptosyltransferase
MRALDPGSVRRILVVKLSSLGDIVHVTPCLRALRRHFPSARIDMAVGACHADLVRQDPNLDGLIESEPRRLGWLARARATRRSLRPYRGTGYDLAIDYQGALRSALHVYLSGARVRAGRGGFRPGWQCVVRPDLRLHAVEVCAGITRALGVPITDLTPEVFLCPHADASLATLLAQAGLPGEGFLLVNPFSRWHSKEWPLDRFAELIRRLTADAKVPVAVSGAAERVADASALLELLGPGRAVSLVGRLSLAEAMCLYRRAAVMVTGDSGPMHVAAAQGTRLVALFGPTHPERTGPWGAGHCVIQKSRPARHHAYREDADRTHIGAIEVGTVYRALVAALIEPPPETGGCCRPTRTAPNAGR